MKPLTMEKKMPSEEKWYIKLLKSFNWKKIAYNAYQAVREDLAKKVLDSESKWDDMALNAIDVLVNKFLKEDAPVAETSS